MRTSPNVHSLADAYARYLIERDLRDVIVVGSSVGGWLASELALGSAADRLAGIVIINGLGIEVRVTRSATSAGWPRRSSPSTASTTPANLRLPAPTPEGLAIAQGNAAALAGLTADASVVERPAGRHPHPGPRDLGRLGPRRRRGLRPCLRRRDPRRSLRAHPDTGHLRTWRTRRRSLRRSTRSWQTRWSSSAS
ncbi:MAG: hypothetical protein WDM88_05780 [Galbitalea sp.]